MQEKAVPCTFRDESECEGCNLNSHLGCRYSKRDFWFFTLNQIPVAVMALFSLVFMGLLAGLWWALIVYVISALVFFGLGLETRILCSHCPYWASDSKLLNCWAYPNTYKFWQYRPGPMNNIEKLLLILFFAFLAFFPVVMTAYGIWLIATSPQLNNLFTLLGIIGITTGTLLAGLQFFYVLQFYFCSRCINFSCPFNRVSTDKMKAEVVPISRTG